jgi:hypothetical protein
MFGRAFGDNPAALGAGLGPDFEDPVGRKEHVEIVLDYHDAVPAIDELLEHAEQTLHVMLVQSGRGLVEQEQRTSVWRC